MKAAAWNLGDKSPRIYNRMPLRNRLWRIVLWATAEDGSHGQNTIEPRKRMDLADIIETAAAELSALAKEKKLQPLAGGGFRVELKR